MVAGTTSCQCALYRAAMSLLGIGEVFLQLSESGLSPTSMLVRLEVFLLRVELLEQVHGLLVHGEYNATTEDEPAQSGDCTTPQLEETFVLEDLDSTVNAVLVQSSGINALHARLDSIDWLGSVDGDDTSSTTDGEGGQSA
jgi:hypothetical protein